MRYIILLLATILLFFPLYWMLTGSLQDIEGIQAMPPKLIPADISLDNYRHVLQGGPALRWLFNTALLVVVGTAAGMMVTVAAGFSFSLYDFKGKKIIFWAFMLTIMIPQYSLIISRFLVVKWLGIGGTLAAAGYPALFWPMGIFLFCKYMDTVPRALFDAARLDGAGELRVIITLALPNAAPMVAALTVFMSFSLLKDYLWQALTLVRPERQTLIVGLISAARIGSGVDIAFVNPIGLLLAAGVMLFIPLLAIFILFQKYFTQTKIYGGLAG